MTLTPSGRHPAGRTRPLFAILALSGALAAAACSAPGGDAPSTGASAPAAVKTTCGTGPVTLKGYFETGFPLPKTLADEFTAQFPNVKWDIREDQFAVITQGRADERTNDRLRDVPDDASTTGRSPAGA